MIASRSAPNAGRLALPPVLLVCFMFCAATVAAQDTTITSVPASEEIEPRVVGAKGTMTLGMSGFVDRSMSSETQLATLYSGHIDVARFVTARIAISGGLSGAGRLGADKDEGADARGRGATALHAFANATYYFTPSAIASFYSGASYWQQLTRRETGDRGTIVGLAGIQGLLSSRSAVFIEGGYGMGLTRGPDEEIVTRIIGRVGFRLKL